MSRPILASLASRAAVAALVLLLLPVRVRAEDAPAETPKPPTTPLPTFENPLWDAEVGETLFYKVRPASGTRDRYYEERVLARDEGNVLVETVETDKTDTKTFSVDVATTGWRPVAKTLVLPADFEWKTDRQRDEVLYVGDPIRAAVRTTLRVLLEPVDVGGAPGQKREREIWFSHDVKASGRVKMYPAQGRGTRMAISWDKRLTAEECAKRAGRYPKDAATGQAGSRGTPTPGGEDPGMAEPGMGEPGMDDAGMNEPGMNEPGMEEPGMEEPSMDGILRRALR